MRDHGTFSSKVQNFPDTQAWERGERDPETEDRRASPRGREGIRVRLTQPVSEGG